jgi:hypothetical protein
MACFPIVLGTSDLVTGISAVIIAVACQCRIDALVVGTFKLFRCAVSILREG